MTGGSGKVGEERGGLATRARGFVVARAGDGRGRTQRGSSRAASIAQGAHWWPDLFATDGGVRPIEVSCISGVTAKVWARRGGRGWGSKEE